MLYVIYFIVVLITLADSIYFLQIKPENGDKAIAQGYFLILLALSFIFSTAVLFFAMSSKGCFNWFSQNVLLRWSMVIILLIAYFVTVFFGVVLLAEWNGDSFYPTYLRMLSSIYVFIWIPILILLPMYGMIQHANTGGAIQGWTKFVFYAGTAICLIYTLGYTYGYLAEMNQRKQDKIQLESERDAKYNQQALEEINNLKPDESIVPILSYTIPESDEVIRNAAIEKIKSRSNWEDELLSLLKDRTLYTNVYYFLSGSKVQHPDLFRQALSKTIDWLIIDVTEYLNNTSNYQYWILDQYNIGRMLDGIDMNFKSERNSFKPQVLQLQEAMKKNTPPSEQKVKYTASIDIDQWL